MYDVLGLYTLQKSLEIGSYVKMLVRRVLSDSYRITQEKFQACNVSHIYTPWYWNFSCVILCHNSADKNRVLTKWGHAWRGYDSPGGILIGQGSMYL